MVLLVHHPLSRSWSLDELATSNTYLMLGYLLLCLCHSYLGFIASWMHWLLELLLLVKGSLEMLYWRLTYTHHLIFLVLLSHHELLLHLLLHHWVHRHTLHLILAVHHHHLLLL